MRVSNWNIESQGAAIVDESMRRLRIAANVVRDAARGKVSGFKHTWKEHGPYNSGKYAGKIWTARDYDALKKTIRCVEKKDVSAFGVQAYQNIWVMSGNYKTWYAAQVEYGRAGWRGGPHPFLRPAVNENKSKINAIMEGRG